MPHPEYWDRIMSKFETYPGAMGVFPLPTTAAAETLKQMLSVAGQGDSPYSGSMACSVVHLKDLTARHDVFVFAFSGNHSGLKLDLRAGNELLKTAILQLPPEKRAQSPRYWYQTGMSSYYVPLHQNTQSFFRGH